MTDDADVSMKFYPAKHDSGHRPIEGIRVIVLHSTEGGSAAGAAAWFQDPRSKGSAHLVVGEDGAYRCLGDDMEPWGAAGENRDGLHIELSGYAVFSKEQWLTRQKTLQLAAKYVAQWCFDYDVPATLLAADALKGDSRGITTHRQVSLAYDGGHGHYDPGPNFPIDVLMTMVQEELSKLPYV